MGTDTEGAWPTSVLPAYSLSWNLMEVDAAPLNQALIVYVPAAVTATQFGESLRTQEAAPVPGLLSAAANPPECPPLTRASVTPVVLPPVFQPVVLLSKPAFATRLLLTTRVAVAVPA